MRPSLLVAVALAVPALAACSDTAASSNGGDARSPRSVSVSSSDERCELSATTAPAPMRAREGLVGH